ncbi:hypothetical protein EYB25_008180 [Talaromyces marneffei]|nr:hypothetical protein EYB25_008180 [Talaromyces marneffei]
MMVRLAQPQSVGTAEAATVVQLSFRRPRLLALSATELNSITAGRVQVFVSAELIVGRSVPTIQIPLLEPGPKNEVGGTRRSNDLRYCAKAAVLRANPLFSVLLSAMLPNSSEHPSPLIQSSSAPRTISIRFRWGGSFCCVCSSADICHEPCLLWKAWPLGVEMTILPSVVELPVSAFASVPSKAWVSATESCHDRPRLKAGQHG